MNTSADDIPLLEMRGVRKAFGATLALDGVDLCVHGGEVHALLGENGAGKSTLMKILSGAIRADAGQISIAGSSFRPTDPIASRAAGVAMIYQELTLAPHLSVEANLTLGREQHLMGVLTRAEQRRQALEALARLDRPDIKPDTPVSALAPAARQLVEIARALMTEARIIVMDEPTSSLGLSDIAHLFKVIRSLKAEGVGIVYISHFLEEVAQIADRYTVLRDGRVAGVGEIASTVSDQLVEMMIGRRLDEMFPRIEHEIGEPVLEISGLSGRTIPVDADLTLHRGEVLGLAGLVGAGRTEFIRCLFGLGAVRSGRVRVAGVAPARWTPAGRWSSGVGMLSEDRATEGLALSRSLAENITLGGHGPVSTLGFIHRRLEQARTRAWLDRLSTKRRSVHQSVRELSGGNQQKIAMARMLYRDVDVLLLDEPTRGIDVGSKTQIYRQIGELAAAGKAIIFASSYVPELLGVCDHIAVMRRGRIGPARPASQCTEHAIIMEATGAAA